MHSKKVLASLVCGLMLTANGVVADEIKQGGTLTVPIIGTGFVENFNPYTTKDLLHGVMFEPLLVFNNMTGKTEYRLAKSVEYSDDLKKVYVTLRDGLKWSDGSALTANDVAFSFNMTKDAAAFDQKGIWSGGNLVSVTASDAKTVVFELNEADSTFVWSLPAYHVVPEKVWSKVEDLTIFTNPDPIGSGPMTSVKYVNAQQMELCRNPHYYLENRPYLDCLTYRSYNDNSQIQPALMKGEIDWGSNFIADVENTFVKANPENHHFWYPANDAIHLYVNTKEAPFDNLQVRQALSVALDREAIVDIAAYGYPTANFNVGGIGELYSTHISKDVSEKYKELTQYNPEKAKALLDEAGLKDRNGDGFRDMPNGETVEFDIEVVNGWTDWIQVVQMVTEYYEEIGIKANVKTVDWAVYDKSLKDSEYKMSINWSMVATNPILAYQEYFSTSRIGKTWHAGHGINSPEIDKLIDSFGKTNEPAQQKEILDELQVFTAENLPFIPLFSNPTWFQYNSSKIAGWPSEDNPYVQPVWYDGGKRVLILNNLHLK
ncbi:ABC transporter substrate-binding protein [Photobacterium gaetbulicola]|uniref:Oligopeptide ABC transporter extracellular solute-binding family 5 protein n=1 Tax=Photobacterium gaetbulicola Gung47 TaxID=658445 RepID=A0A0C5WJ75_9GAMM|nr:ABC transporter substrate-binding protein [Photobacterium gaetbulicola]AJR06237.1 oligopeptide ABC transporter extracellular solute-binding family 5 protein [Photobacterium gaetbulicola Gung47]PSU08815.1 ABC transporter substrate-binding protein [Photobacterium gaetbulicola]